MTTTTEPRWWSTTWGRLAPGDEVRAPDGSVWTVGSAITSDGAGEWRITRPSESLEVWTSHREDEPVTARRPDAPDGAIDLPLMLGRLRAVLGDVEPVPISVLDRPGAGRWVGCGARECRCR